MDEVMNLPDSPGNKIQQKLGPKSSLEITTEQMLEDIKKK
jgi:hypothetical protein